jgi:hypothetical protein
MFRLEWLMTALAELLPKLLTAYFVSYSAKD